MSPESSSDAGNTLKMAGRVSPCVPARGRPRRILGLEPGEARVVRYDPEWPQLYQQIQARLRPALPAARIEHVGSTAVPGCDAKPIIDISVGLAPGSALRVGEALSVGLEFRSIRPYSVVFALSGDEGERLAHIHVRYRDSESELGDLRFRDFLRTHPGVVREYSELKRSVAGTAGSRGRYTEAKAPFIEGLQPRIGRWARRTHWAP